MAYEIPRFTRSYEALVDLSASRYKFVKMSGAVVVAIAAATDPGIGVLQNQPNKAGTGVFVGGQNNAATVMISGVSRVISGKALAAGVKVYLDATGAATDVVQAGQCVGYTETSCAGSGQVVAVNLKPLGALN